MQAEVYWIAGVSAGRLAIMPRPRGGDWLEDEVTSLQEQGVSTIVSLLERHEELELGLADEELLASAADLEFLRLALPDRGVPPDAASVRRLVHVIGARLVAGTGVAIHCRQGLGRSAMIAACVLVRLGVTPYDAFRSIEVARGLAVPDTEEQREWVETFAKSDGPTP